MTKNRARLILLVAVGLLYGCAPVLIYGNEATVQIGNMRRFNEAEGFGFSLPREGATATACSR